MKKLPEEEIDSLVELLGSVDAVIEKYRAKYPDAPFEMPGFVERIQMAQMLAQQQLGTLFEKSLQDAVRVAAAEAAGKVGQGVYLQPSKPGVPLSQGPIPQARPGAPAIGVGADGQARLIEPDPAFLKRAHEGWEELLKKESFPVGAWNRLKTLLRETEQGRSILTTLSYENYKLRTVQHPVVSDPKPQSPPPPQGPPPAPPKKGGKK